MTDYSQLPRGEASRRAKHSWRQARAVKEVLSIKTATEARSWLKHFREDGVNIRDLMEGKADAVAQARAVLKRLGQPVKDPPPPTPIERSAKKAKKAMDNPDSQADTMRQKVQIMLWALGKCGTANDAVEALHRALVAAGESAHAMTDHVLKCDGCFEDIIAESRRRYTAYLDATKEQDTYSPNTVFVDAEPTAVKAEDWPDYRAKLGREQPKRVVHFVGYGSYLATQDLTLEQFEDILDEYNDIDASLILEGYKAMGGEHAEAA